MEPFSAPADPYVKVWLMHKDKRVEKKKTVVMKRCLNPVFNESFPFDVPAHVLRETTIIITVMDKDKLSRNDVIGKVPSSSSSSSCFLDSCSLLSSAVQSDPVTERPQAITEPVSTDPCWNSHLQRPNNLRQSATVIYYLKVSSGVMSRTAARHEGRCACAGA